MNELATPVTLAVVGVTVGVSLYAFRSPAFLARWLLEPAAVLERRQWGRLVSSGFLHGGFAHLFFNMYTLWSFGRVLEFVHGPRAFLIVYFTAVVGGSLVSTYLHRHEPSYRALGASGGVSGVIFAVIFLFPAGGIRLMFIPVDIPSWLFALGFVVGSYWALRRQVGNIGHDAHLGGALCGLAAAVFLFPDIPARRPVLFAAVIVITAGLLWHARAYPMQGARRGGSRNLQELADRLRRSATSARERQDAERLDALLAEVARVGLAGLSEAARDELKAIADRRGRRPGGPGSA